MIANILTGLGIATMVILILLVSFLRKGTIYFMGDSGYASLTSKHRSDVHEVDEGQLRSAVESLMQGDLFDMLWVSTVNDEMTGFMLDAVDEGKVTLGASFKTQAEKTAIGAFKEAMAAEGYNAVEDSEGFNGGWGEKFRTTSLDYALPRSADDTMKAIKVVLKHLQLEGEGRYYIGASKFSSGPGARKGIRLAPNADPLDQILNPNGGPS